MDDARRLREDRWLPYLAAALLVEAAAGFLPAVAHAGASGTAAFHPAPWAFHVKAALATLLACGCIVGHFRRNDADRIRALFMVAVSSMAVSQFISAVAPFLGRDSSFGSFAGVFLLHVPSVILIGTGAPLLWGAAMARRDHPEDTRIARLGRIGAGLAIGGFVLSVLQQVPSMIHLFRNLSQLSAGLYPLFSVLDVAWRVLFLWSAIDVFRRAPDPALGRLRMRRVVRLMWGTVAVALISTGLMVLVHSGIGPRTQPVLPNLWRNALYLTMLLVTAFATARWARSVASPPGGAS